jgi:uncharacterized protein
MANRLRCLVCAALFSLFGWHSAKAGAAYGPDHYFDKPADKQMALAIADGDIRTIERLIKAGEVNPLAVGRDATNWLTIAILARQKKALDKLLELGALGDPKGKIAGQALYNATLVGTATPFGDLYWVRRLREAGADLNNYGGGDLLLEVAVDTRNPKMLDFYLENGADINMPSNVGGSVALGAAETRRFDLVNEFLDRGASPWVMDAMGATLGFIAERAGKVPAWDHQSQMNRERVRLLQRLHAIGFPNPAPTPDEGHALRQAGKWPPNMPNTVKPR